MNDSEDARDVDKRRVLIAFVVVSILLLGGALLAGRLLGESRAATQNRDAGAKLATAQDQISQLESASYSLQQERDALQTDLASTQGQLYQLQTQYVRLQDNNAALQAQLASAQQTIAQLQAQLASAQQTIAQLQAQLASAQQTIAQLQAQLASAQQTIATLQAQLTSTQQAIADLQTQYKSALQNITELQTQLAAWYAWSRTAPSGPSLTLSPASGSPGTSITITGSGFTTVTGGNVALDINRNGVADPGEPTQNITTSSGGTLSATLVVPLLPPSSYPVLAAIPAGTAAPASATFSVTTGAGQ